MESLDCNRLTIARCAHVPRRACGGVHIERIALIAAFEVCDAFCIGRSGSMKSSAIPYVRLIRPAPAR